MYLPHSRGLPAQAGASVLAALVIVAVLGAIALAIQAAAPKTAMVESKSQAAGICVGTPKECGLDNPCKPGEVHSVVVSNGSVAKPTENPPGGLKCWTYDSMVGGMIKISDDPVCDVSHEDKCVVRYCPPDSLVSKPGTCVVINCDPNNGGESCLNKGMQSAMSSNPTAALTQLATQGQTLGICQAGGSCVSPSGSANGSQYLSDALSQYGKQSVASEANILRAHADDRTAAELYNLQQTLQPGGDNFPTGSVTKPPVALDPALTRNPYELQYTPNSGCSGGNLPCSNQNPMGGDTNSSNPCPSGNLPCAVGGTPAGSGNQTSSTFYEPGGSSIVPSADKGDATCEWWNVSCRLSKLSVQRNPYETEVAPGDTTSPPPIPRDKPTPPESCGFSCGVGKVVTSISKGVGDLFGGGSGLGSFVTGLLGGLGGGGGAGGPPPGNTEPQPRGSCPTQYICGNNTMYYRHDNCVDEPLQACRYGCTKNSSGGNGTSSFFGSQGSGGNYGSTCATQQQQHDQQNGNGNGNGNGTDGNGNKCPSPVPQPNASGCTAGTWKPVSNNLCNVGWQCVPGSQNAPSATLSCQPQTVEVGMSVAMSYACQNSTDSSGTGFDTGKKLSGSAAVSVVAPQPGMSSVVYTLTCNNKGVTASAQCKVDINKSSIILIANPSVVAVGDTTSVGWVTSGIKSCVVSSPDTQDFTAANAARASANGAVQTPPILGETRIQLRCETLAGATKEASVTISIGTVGSKISFSSSADGATIAHGSTVTIRWSAPNPPADSLMSLWLIDATTQTATTLIAGAQPVKGSYTWHVPTPADTCVAGSAKVCASDLVIGKTYAIQAVLYSPVNAYIGDGAPQPDALTPTYGASTVGKVFIVTQ